MYYRGGEWHYYQAIIFYEKNWLNESKKQLELAIDIDPENEKYKRALENMKKKINGEGAFKQAPQDGQQTQNFTSRSGYATDRSYTQQSAAGSAADGCCAACQCAICADCCCECLGGDLIRCC